MKIISWNVNGIRAVYKKGFLDWFKLQNADIVCLQETKAAIEQFPEELVEFAGYNFYSFSAQKKGYSGVAVWTKIRPDFVYKGIGEKIFDDEGRVLILKFKKFILFNVYFPNGGASEERLKFKMDFYDYLLGYVKKFKDDKVVICGDYNTAHFPIDLARPKENEKHSGFMAEEREKLDKLECEGFADSFRYFNKEPGNYTWWDYKTSARERNIGWRIDYFFVSQNCLNFLKSAKIQSKIFGSDHCPIEIEIF
jgi:exodeoxyribonuclease-3